MKTNTFNLTFLVLTIGLFFTSCTKETIQLPETFDTPTYFNLSHASSDCPDESAIKEYEFYHNSNYRGTLTYCDPICIGGETEFIFDDFAAPQNNIHIQVWDEDENDWENVAGFPSNQSPPFSAFVTAPEVGTFEFRARIGNSGWVEFEVNAINCDDCEDDFSAALECDAGGNKTLKVTFTAADAGDYVIQGGLTNGTTIVNRIADAGFNENTTHPSVVNSNANVTRWEGSLDACETVTIVIDFTGGNGVGDWSAKSVVDGVQVTNGESDDQDCP